MGVTAANHTRFQRKESVLFGSETRTSCTCFEVPGGFLNVSLVDVEPNEHADIEPARYTSRVFERHPAITEAIGNGMKFRAHVNGVWQDFAPAPGGNNGLIVDHARVQIRRWKVLDSGGRGSLHLFVYEFSEQATLRYELLYFAEFLNGLPQTVTLGFDVTDSSNVRSANIRELVAYHFANPNDMPGGGMSYKDAGGLYAEGCIPFETAAMRADRIANRFNLEVSTQSAQMLSPLYAGVPHPTFGVFEQPPLTPPLVTEQGRNIEAGRRMSFYIIDGNGDPTKPDDYLGVVSSKTPNQGGSQAGFGSWSHVMNGLGGGLPTGIDARSLWHQHTAAMREVNRGVWFMEADGEILNPATNFFMADGSNARTWSEEINWGAAAANRFRRTNPGVFINQGWFGHRNEHKGWNFLAHDFLLTGSFAARHLLIAIQSNVNCEDPTVGYGESRAIGRVGLMAAWTYRATGVDVMLQWFAREVWAGVYSRWTNILCDPLDPVRAYATNNSPQTIGYAAGTWYWSPWQGGIMIAGLDALLRVDTVANVFTAAQRNEMEEILGYEAEALVNLAYAPAHTCGTTNYADASIWCVNINFGTGARPVAPTLLPADYCSDIANPNRKVTRTDDPGGASDFHFSWPYMGVPIAARFNPALAARAAIIRAYWEPHFIDAVPHLQHIGVG